MIWVQHLTRRFGEREVVRDIDIEVRVGQRIALRGPNGSGKTTVIRCILGTVAPSAGVIEIGSHPAGSLAARALIGATLAQERSFYLRLSGRRNLLFFARVRGLSAREAERAVSAVIEELELEEITAERCDRCSSGMLQQVALARALLTSPPVLLLDEPTRSLDTEARGRLWAALDRRPNAAVLLATHLDEDLAHVGQVIELERSP